MISKLSIKNFKRFETVALDLSETVVFVGPNNSGKTTALQALSLWELGLRKWFERKGTQSSAASIRQGVVLNRRDLWAIPAPTGKMIWRDLEVRSSSKLNGQSQTKNILIEIDVEGISNGEPWHCGLEFDFANEESLYVRPMRLDDNGDKRLTPPQIALGTKIAFLPPMSGLAAEEFYKQDGEVNSLIGQGQTAQVLRNICWKVAYPNGTEAISPAWTKIVTLIETLFGVHLNSPIYFAERAELRLDYLFKPGNNGRLDISSAGRGLQQTLLLLAFLALNPGSVLLLDEPDAHLETILQREIYRTICDEAAQTGSQIIAASHSEVILNEAAQRGSVVAFIGQPHTLNDRGSQLAKALSSIGWEQYYLAEQKGWILYLEGATDLAMLIAFAEKLDKPDCARALQTCFVQYLGTNIPVDARNHFHGLREAKPDLLGFLLLDRIDKPLMENQPLVERMWLKRELESYFVNPKVLLNWISHMPSYDLFYLAESDRIQNAMSESISEIEAAQRTLGKPDAWGSDVKVSDNILTPILRLVSDKTGNPILLSKNSYWKLVEYIDRTDVDPEIERVLDEIMAIAAQAEAKNTRIITSS